MNVGQQTGTAGCVGGLAGLDRQRAQIVLAAACGYPNARIAAGLGISVDTVRKWRGRFTASDLHGLMDRISRHEQQDHPQDEPLPEAA